MKPLAVILLLGGGLSSCASSTLYQADGRPLLRIGGNLTYQHTAQGDVVITLNHSDVIRSQGNASTKALTALGTAATAIVLAP